MADSPGENEYLAEDYINNLNALTQTPQAPSVLPAPNVASITLYASLRDQLHDLSEERKGAGEMARYWAERVTDLDKTISAIETVMNATTGAVIPPEETDNGSSGNTRRRGNRPQAEQGGSPS